jgi:hypothetical protein
MNRLVTGGIVLSAIVFGFAVLFFFQYKDPVLLAFAGQAIVPIWIAILVIHVLREGLPVRVVVEDRRRPLDEERPQP